MIFDVAKTLLSFGIDVQNYTHVCLEGHQAYFSEQKRHGFSASSIHLYRLDGQKVRSIRIQIKPGINEKVEIGDATFFADYPLHVFEEWWSSIKNSDKYYILI